MPERQASRSVRTLCAGLAIGEAGLAAIVCFARPDALAALILVPAWCWLFAGAGSSAIVWRLGLRRLATVLLAGWTMFAVLVVEEVVSVPRGWFAASHSGTRLERTLRIVSLNCASTVQCVEDLERVSPDIVLLQEAPDREGLRRMAERLFGGAGEFVEAGDAAILVRSTLDPGSVVRGRHFVAARVRLGEERVLDVVSLRLAPPVSRLDFWSGGFWSDHWALRFTHVRQLREVLGATSELVSDRRIVGGDFNMPPLDPALEVLRPELRDSFGRSGRGWGATGTNAWPLFRVDQVWTSPGVVPSAVFAVKTVHSDHRMVVCDVVLGDGKEGSPLTP